MYRPELDELISLFQKSCASVVISDNQYRYESLDEMKAHVGIRIKDLDIRGARPGVHFLLNQKEYVPGSSTPNVFNELRTEELTDEAEALFLRIKEVLAEHQRPNAATFAIPSLFFILLLAPLAGFGRHLSLTYQLISVVSFITLSVLFLLIGIANGRNQLLLESKLNAPTFFVRNREEFAKHAVSGVIGGLIGYVFGHFLK
jgi:hypothetical protein